MPGWTGRVLPWVLAFAGACGGGTRPREVAMGTAEVGGQVVSTVDGEPVDAAEIRAMTRATELAPREVLRRLQDRVLLMREAERRGFTGGREGERVTQKALVQSLLAERVEGEPVTDAMLRDAYAAQLARFDVPERRASAHVLVRIKGEETPDLLRRAGALAERARSLMAREPDFQQVRAEIRGWSADGLRIKGEELPAVPREGRFDADFTAALFAPDAPGTLPAVVRTRFGYHAVRLTEIIPPQRTDFVDARSTLRDELTLAQRERALDQLLRELADSVRVERYPDAIAALARIEL